MGHPPNPLAQRGAGWKIGGVILTGDCLGGSYGGGYLLCCPVVQQRFLGT